MLVVDMFIGYVWSWLSGLDLCCTIVVLDVSIPEVLSPYLSYKESGTHNGTW